MNSSPIANPQQPEGLGFVNAHTHIYSALAPLGIPDPQPSPTNFLEILERVWWLLDRALDAPSLKASAEMYVAESLVAGTTVLLDHHESPNFIEGSLDVMHDACEEFGMHALLCYGITERNSGPEEAQRGLAENRRFLSRERSSLVHGAVGLHASFTVSDESIRAAAELSDEFGAPLHIHVAEDLADVKDAKERGYTGVIDRLDKLGALTARSILAHGVHLTLKEVELASERGAWFVQNPRSNRANGVGYPRYLKSAARVALGTDGFPSGMHVEQDTLMQDARKAEARGFRGEEESAALRLAAGGTLALQLFPELAQSTEKPPRPSADQLTTIRETARHEAKRLSQRMIEMR
jgi:cytosine/adenosine deaminase-related metal-dependent hydrolase